MTRYVNLIQTHVRRKIELISILRIICCIRSAFAYCEPSFRLPLNFVDWPIAEITTLWGVGVRGASPPLEKQLPPLDFSHKKLNKPP